ncbi:MAG: MraY family glycosyltransferase [Bacteroidia bacterium]
MWGFLIIVFFTSFLVVLLSTPSLIKVAILKRLFDAPGEERKLHKRMVPTIGGIILFAGTLFSFSLWFPSEYLSTYEAMRVPITQFKYLIATMLILFFVGVKDDIIGTAPIKKLVAHIIVGMILVLMAGVRLTGLHGIFGIHELPYWASVFLSMFTYIVVVNAFNLIDGVDGLAAGIGAICAIAFGLWFAFAGDFVMACLAFALAGSLIGFLIFNFSPAKLFMGDSGSLTIGLIICVLAINLIEFDQTKLSGFLAQLSKPVFVMSVLVYPLVDTLRIFIYRAVRGVSPFSADRNHLHHALLDLGLNHRKICYTLYLFNALIIGLSVCLLKLDPSYSFLIVGGCALITSQIPFFLKRKKQQLRNEKDVAETKIERAAQK